MSGTTSHSKVSAKILHHCIKLCLLAFVDSFLLEQHSMLHSQAKSIHTPTVFLDKEVMQCIALKPVVQSSTLVFWYNAI